MDLQAFWEGAIAGYGIAVPVGAIAVLIIDASIRRGLLSGMQAGAGAASADLIYAAIATISGTLLQSWLIPLAGIFRVLGGVALLAMGGWGLWRLWKSRGVGVEAETASAQPGRIYLTFLGLTLLNPLTIVYFSALILGDIAADRTTLNRLFFVLGAGLASLSWQWLLAAFGALAGRSLPSRAGWILGALGNLVVLFLGLRLLI
ncbi:MAG: lysine transporter LysE [Anaerolineales bacterium]|nr:MAG: lysine transporter LysE [Anaerolineales bacterium]